MRLPQNFCSSNAVNLSVPGVVRVELKLACPNYFVVPSLGARSRSLRQLGVTSAAHRFHIAARATPSVQKGLDSSTC